MAAENGSAVTSNEERMSGRFQFPEEKAHEFVKYSMGNVLLRASVDLSQPQLKVLDLGTGSGQSKPYPQVTPATLLMTAMAMQAPG